MKTIIGGTKIARWRRLIESIRYTRQRTLRRRSAVEPCGR